MTTGKDIAGRLNNDVAAKAQKLREEGLALAKSQSKLSTYREAIDAFAKKLEPNNGDTYDVLRRHLELKIKTILLESIKNNESPVENVANWIPSILNGYLDDQCIGTIENTFDRFMGKILIRDAAGKAIPDAWSAETANKIYQQILSSIHRTSIAPF